jgi:hypothetical protein
VQIDVMTGEGEIIKITLAPTATVLRVKEAMEREVGIPVRNACLFSMSAAFEEELHDETVGSLQEGEGEKVLMSLLVQEPDAQQVVPRLAAEADMTLGDGTPGQSDDKLFMPFDAAFVPDHLEWLVTTESAGNRVKISNIHTGALVCKFGVGQGNACGQLNRPLGVAVTADSSYVLVADTANNRVQVLRLVVNAFGSSALVFAHCIGNGEGSANGELRGPSGIALLRGEDGRESVVISEQRNHRVSQFALDGTFLRIFAGTGRGGRGGANVKGRGDGEFDSPRRMVVLPSTGELAVTDCHNHRVQIFDSKGNYKRQFGREGKDADGHFDRPSAGKHRLICSHAKTRPNHYEFAVTADVHGNLLVLDWTERLQVFNPNGKHLCTRNDLGCDVNRSVSLPPPLLLCSRCSFPLVRVTMVCRL